jgi:hypothetical protein
MSLYDTVLLTRRIFSSGYSLQSLAGVAIPGKGTWLLSPIDPHVTTVLGSERYPLETGGTQRLETFACYVGAFLDAQFPDDSFEIFRLHIHRYEADPDLEVYGERIAEWDAPLPLGAPRSTEPAHFAIGFEHLAGGYYADHDVLVSRLRNHTWSSLIHKAPCPLAPSFEQFLIEHPDPLPHPGMLPLDDWFRQYLAEAKLTGRLGPESRLVM